jgi:hypothetical protein
MIPSPQSRRTSQQSIPLALPASGEGFGSLTLNSAVLVPEPATWAMLMLGFAGLGFAGYHASRNTAFAA